MKALSLTQPWASMVATGVKLIENRTWAAPRTMIGQRFAIHASARMGADELHTAKRLFVDKAYGADIISPYPTMKDFPRSAIVGVATLLRVTHAAGPFTEADLDTMEISKDQQRWWFGPYGFVLCDVRNFAPITNVHGALSFWEMGEPLTDAVLRSVMHTTTFHRNPEG
jgi:ASCH domain